MNNLVFKRCLYCDDWQKVEQKHRVCDACGCTLVSNEAYFEGSRRTHARVSPGTRKRSGRSFKGRLS